MMAQSAAVPPPVEMAPAIRLSDVRVGFRGRAVLRGVDLDVPRGSLLGLVGLNGAGKTTTLRIILGLLRPRSGHVEVLGRPAAHIATCAPRVGATLHLPGLDPRLSVRDNLRQHAYLHGRRADPAPILARLQLDYIAGRTVARISQGERQRVALARALLLEPELLVLDEPLTHLDPGAVFSVLDVLREEVAQRGRTVLLSSHQLELVEQAADRLALLHGGAVLRAGTMGELLSGTGERFVARVDSVERARSLLLAADGIERVGLLESGGQQYGRPADGFSDLIIEGQATDPAELNASLHQHGVRVALFVPEQRTLASVFRAAVEADVRASGRAGDEP